MALTTAYLTSAKNLEAILNSIVSAQAPERFTQKFLENLGFKGTADRLMIGVLKGLGFLGDGGEPTERYYRFLDQSESGKVLAEGIRDAYDELFAVRVDAQKMQQADVVNKLRTLTQGKYSDGVLKKMAMTFTKLADLADWEATSHTVESIGEGQDAVGGEPKQVEPSLPVAPSLRLDGLVYNIELVLPATRDQAIYDALFRSLSAHLKQ